MPACTIFLQYWQKIYFRQRKKAETFTNILLAACNRLRIRKRGLSFFYNQKPPLFFCKWVVQFFRSTI